MFVIESFAFNKLLDWGELNLYIEDKKFNMQIFIL